MILRRYYKCGVSGKQPSEEEKAVVASAATVALLLGAVAVFDMWGSISMLLPFTFLMTLTSSIVVVVVALPPPPPLPPPPKQRLLLFLPLFPLLSLLLPLLLVFPSYIIITAHATATAAGAAAGGGAAGAASCGSYFYAPLPQCHHIIRPAVFAADGPQDFSLLRADTNILLLPVLSALCTCSNTRSKSNNNNVNTVVRGGSCGYYCSLATHFLRKEKATRLSSHRSSSSTSSTNIGKNKASTNLRSKMFRNNRACSRNVFPHFSSSSFSSVSEQQQGLSCLFEALLHLDHHHHHPFPHDNDRAYHTTSPLSPISRRVAVGGVVGVGVVAASTLLEVSGALVNRVAALEKTEGRVIEKKKKKKNGAAEEKTFSSSSFWMPKVIDNVAARTPSEGAANTAVPPVVIRETPSAARTHKKRTANAAVALMKKRHSNYFRETFCFIIPRLYIPSLLLHHKSTMIDERDRKGERKGERTATSFYCPVERMSLSAEGAATPNYAKRDFLCRQFTMLPQGLYSPRTCRCECLCGNYPPNTYTYLSIVKRACGGDDSNNIISISTRERCCSNVLYATKKGAGSTRNGRDSNPKFLGVKRFGGEFVVPGNIIVRQRGTNYKPGDGVKLCRDHSLAAVRSGYVDFTPVYKYEFCFKNQKWLRRHRRKVHAGCYLVSVVEKREDMRNERQREQLRLLRTLANAWVHGRLDAGDNTAATEATSEHAQQGPVKDEE